MSIPRPTVTPPLPSSSLSSPLKQQKQRRLCRHQGCTSVIKSQGLCQRHGAIPARCKISGCTKQAQGSFQGMCKAHYQVYVEAKTRTASALVRHAAYHHPSSSSVTAVLSSQRGHNPSSARHYYNHFVSEDEEAATISRRPSTSSNSSSSAREEQHFYPTSTNTWERPYYCQSSSFMRREELAADLFTPNYGMTTTPTVGEMLLLPLYMVESSDYKSSRTSWNAYPATSTRKTTPVIVLSTSEFEGLDFSDIDHLDLSDMDHFFDFDENDLEFVSL